jgi:2-aminoadipate transaminase
LKNFFCCSKLIPELMKHRGLSEMARRTAEPPISWLMKLTLDKPNLISLAAGFTDNPSLPVAETAGLLGELLKPPASGQQALQYGSTAGDPVLRRLTAERFQSLDRADDTESYSPGRVLMTHGSQQLLYLTAETLCDPGDIVLVEDPTYFVFLGITESRGLITRGLRLEPDGIDITHLEQTLEELKRKGLLPRLKLLYLVTYFQNPTGATTSLEKKAQALELLKRYEPAAGHPIYLLEDAAYRELGFPGVDAPASALSVRGAGGRVIYAGTYSKPYATGIRVGFGILPEPLYTLALRLKGNHDFGTANLLQHLLARALESGTFAKHLSTLRERYAAKAAVMMEAARREFPASVEWRAPDGGLYLWARLPQRILSGTESRLFKGALAREVLYVPGELCYAQDETRPKPNHEMRLSFGGASEDDMREGICRLSAALHELLD